MVDISKLPLVVLGEEKFYVFGGLYPDSEYGVGGAVWLIEESAKLQLAKGGIDGVLGHPDTKESARIFFQPQGVIGPDPGLLIDYHNDPFNDYDPLWDDDEPEYPAKGFIDSLLTRDEKDHLVSIIRENLNGVFNATVQRIKDGYGPKQPMTITHAFFDDVKNPLEVIAKIFAEHQYTVSGVNTGLWTTVKIQISLEHLSD